MVELNLFHGDVVPSLGAAFRGFVIAEQSHLTHQPTKGLLHDPAAWQAFDARNDVGTPMALTTSLGRVP